jgi:hypothetical protein
MNKMYLPTVGPQDWQKLLADPEKQWRTGYSARTIAYAWEGYCQLENGAERCVKIAL